MPSKRQPAPKAWWDTGITERIKKKRKAKTAARAALAELEGATAPLLPGQPPIDTEWRKDMHRASYVMVLENSDGSKAWMQEEFVPRLLMAGLRCAAHESSCRTRVRAAEIGAARHELHTHLAHVQVFLHVFASASRLLYEADLRNTYLKLSPQELRQADIKANAALQAAGLQFNPEPQPKALEEEELAIPTAPGGAALDPYEYIYAPYHSSVPSQLWDRDPDTQAILSNTQALTLLKIIIEGPTGEGGAGWNLGRLMVGDKKRLLKYFPAKFASSYADLYEKWYRWCTVPWWAPVDDIKAVMGAEIAMYFAFVGFLTKSLIVPGIVGLATFVYQYATGTVTSLTWLPVLGLVMAVWCTVLTELWKREQNMLALRWGTLHFERTEVLRPEYMASAEVSKKRSLITGKPTFFTDPAIARLKNSVSLLAVTASAGLIIIVVLSVFVTRGLLAKAEVAAHLPAHSSSTISSFINALIIQIAGFLYKRMAGMLTDWENHPTESAYMDSLILKRVVFDFVNNFFPLFFIIAKSFDSFKLLGADVTCKSAYLHTGSPCLSELQTSVLIIFITRLTVGNITELLLPCLMRSVTSCRRKCASTPKNLPVTPGGRLAGVVSAAEEDADLDSEAVLEEYLEVLITFAFAALFMTAFPLAPIIAALAFYVEMRVDAFKLLKGSTRPEPRAAQDIGSWLLCFELIGIICVITNFMIVVFVADEFFGVHDRYAKLVLFIVLQYGVFAVKLIIAAAVPDQPSQVALQQERGEYLVGKHLDGIPDEITSVAALQAAEDENTGASDGVAGSGQAAAAKADSGADPRTGTALYNQRLADVVTKVDAAWRVGGDEDSMVPSPDMWGQGTQRLRRLRPSDASTIDTDDSMSYISTASGTGGILLTRRKGAQGDSKAQPVAAASPEQPLTQASSARAYGTINGSQRGGSSSSS